MHIDDKVLHRLMKSCNYRSKTDLAKAHGMSLQNFSNKQRTGTLVELVVIEALRHDVNLNYIFTGQGKERMADPNMGWAADFSGGGVAEPLAPYGRSEEDEDDAGDEIGGDTAPRTLAEASSSENKARLRALEERLASLERLISQLLPPKA